MRDSNPENLDVDVKKLLGCEIENLDRYIVPFSAATTKPVYTKPKTEKKKHDWKFWK